MTSIVKVKKRDGRVVDFNSTKITEAIFKAANSVGGSDVNLAEDLTSQVIKILEEKYGKENMPSVETIQDIVEKVLIEGGHAKTAKAYILYRQKRAELRKYRDLIGVKEDGLKLPLNVITVLAARYLKRDSERNIIETPDQLFKRVSRAIAESDKLYGE